MVRKKEKREERKEKKEISNEQIEDFNNCFSLLVSDPEWELVKTLAAYPVKIRESAEDLDPSHLTGFLYDLSKSFSRFYHECPILNCDDPILSKARLELSRAVMMVLKDAFHLVCIPFLEVM